MKKNVARILTAVLMLSVIFSSSVFAAEKQQSAWESFVGLFSGSATAAEDTQIDGITYRTHIQNDGWAQGWVSDGTTSGSEGRGLRLEGIEIKIDGDNLPDGLGVTYRTQIENDGWLDWETDGDTSGSVGKGLRLEAIEIKLTGDDAGDYSVGYKTHVQNYGWEKDWSYNGDTSGTVGEGLRLEGIQIEIFKNIPDLTEYEAALAAVTQADYTAASWTTYQAVVAANVVTEDNLVSEVEEATAAITAAQANLVKVLKVESVSAINGDQVTVKFNQDVTAMTLAKSNFTVTQAGDAAGKDRFTDSATATNTAVTGQVVNTGILQKSADTVTLTMDNQAYFTNGKTITVKTSGITDMADDTKTAVLNDVLAPSIVSAASTGSNSFRVVFNEPVFDGVKANDNYTTADFKANFVVNDGGVAITKVNKDAANPNAVIVTTSGNLVKDSKYTVKVNSGSTAILQDYVGYKVMAGAALEFTHTVATDLPTVSGEAKNESTVRLTFDRAVTVPWNANIEYRYAYNATGANKVLGNAATLANASGLVTAVTNSNNTQFDIKSFSAMTPGEGKLFIYYKAAADATKSNVITDAYGNVVPSGTEVTFTVTQDTSAPTATVVYKSATQLDVTYSKAVTGGTTAANYAVKDPKGNVVNISGVTEIDAATYKYRLTVTDMSEGGNFTVSIGSGIKDTSVYQTAFVPATFTVAVTDTKKPTVVGTIGQNATGDKLYVYYSEAMGTSATDVANYRLVGTGQYQMPAGTTITQSGSTVTINLPETLTSLKTTLGSAAVIGNLFVGAVTDVAGNQIATMQNVAISPYSANFTATASDAKLLSDTQISFKVDRPLKAVDATKINVNGGTGDKIATAASVVNGTDGKATVTVTFKAKQLASGTTTVTTRPAAIDTTINLAAGAFTDNNDLLSSGTTIANTSFADYAAPQIKSVETVGDTDGKLTQVKVTYTENIYPASVQQSDYVLDTHTIKAIATTGTGGALTSDIVAIDLNKSSSADTGVTPIVTQQGEIEDAIAYVAPQSARNILGAQTAITATDKAAPVVVQSKASNTAVTGASALLTTSGGSAATAASTLNSLFVTTNNVSITNGDVITIAGTLNGSAVTRDFTVTTATTATVQNLMTEIETAFGLSAGKVTLTAGALGITATDGKYIEGLTLTLQAAATNKTQFDTAFAAGKFTYVGQSILTYSENVRMLTTGAPFTSTASLTAAGVGTGAAGTLSGVDTLAVASGNTVRATYTALPTVVSDPTTTNRSTVVGKAAAIEDDLTGITNGLANTQAVGALIVNIY
ncbi:hypothetical protein GH811_06640 [Acetobacterium malicum]|uniref:SbsA Ig-like domain-containing protein n=1 Tax=Acetobacterium malicum TaxID=52692 RepID=A0ABR6YVS3_9FIRM|nr:hypothetical protein [Acetobacterium malicum]MBC3899288.1 hypothetical protein [Acetobacterium malicum]